MKYVIIFPIYMIIIAACLIKGAPIIFIIILSLAFVAVLTPLYNIVGRILGAEKIKVETAYEVPEYKGKNKWIVPLVVFFIVQLIIFLLIQMK